MDGAQESAGGTGTVAEVRGFLEATRAEMGKVTWPTKPELIRTTRVIVIMSVVLGVVIGLMDWGLQKILVDGVAALAR